MNKELARFLNIISVPINGLFAWLKLSEYYTVAIKEEISGYPFGGEGPTPSYYESADSYATVMIIYGLIFLFLFLLGIWNIKAKLVHGHLMLMTSFGLILVSIFHSLS